jgi:hypothetical protein
MTHLPFAKFYPLAHKKEVEISQLGVEGLLSA